ncbi:MAG: hypothetical protein EP329_17770, partial [Deltaproteobacteria bacterium]
QAHPPALAQPAAARGLALPTAGSGKLTAVFSGIERRGTWAVPEKLKLRAVFGGIELDLRTAELTADVTELHCHAVFGGIDLTVPPDVYVEVTGTGIFGGFDQDHRHPSAPLEQARKIVRISGRAVFGGVSIRVREAGEPDGLLGRIRHHRGRRRRPPEPPRLEDKRDDDGKYW